MKDKKKQTITQDEVGVLPFEAIEEIMPDAPPSDVKGKNLDFGIALKRLKLGGHIARENLYWRKANYWKKAGNQIHCVDEQGTPHAVGQVLMDDLFADDWYEL